MRTKTWFITRRYSVFLVKNRVFSDKHCLSIEKQSFPGEEQGFSCGEKPCFSDEHCLSVEKQCFSEKNNASLVKNHVFSEKNSAFQDYRISSHISRIF